jgi:exodeoxyribonuclease VII large subunit
MSSSQTDSHSTLAKRPVKDIYVVSRLVREARAVIEGSFPLVWVEGEISNLAMPASGHIYFTLKDEAAQVRCAMFKGRNRQLRFVPENGMQVLLRVRLTLYEGRGEFQLVVEHMEEAGSGALQRAYEALKHRLGEEGLFDEAHKKSLPTLAKSIGVVSSPNGAAVHDILTVLKRRFPAAQVILYPVAVQGTGSAEQIAEAIALADKRQECDVLIVGRGGGSLEDLWSFNDERVARALFACSIPIISAVGHEIDFTIADFVADVRAATPSAAAELAVPDVADYIQKLQTQYRRLNLLMTHYLQNEQHHLRYLKQRLPQPQMMISQQMQTIDRLDQLRHRVWQHALDKRRQRLQYLTLRLKHPQSKIDKQKLHLSRLQQRLNRAIEQRHGLQQKQLSKLLQRFSGHAPSPRIIEQQHRLKQLQSRLYNEIKQCVPQRALKLQQQIRTLSAVSPLNTLERGYSITTALETGKVIAHAQQVELGEHVLVRLQQGQLTCQVQEINND